MAAVGKTRKMQNFDIIQPSLIQQMKSILDQYPDDGQILKELIQNAEDAKAKTIKFLFDKSTFPASPEQMEHKDLVHFQGPALYAFNDATFSEEDWIGIRTIYDSFKKDDPIKVGRFGLGFKSVFHMTDMPSILSGSKIGFLDPHEKYFHDDEGRALKGACWNLSDIDDDQSGFYNPFTDTSLSSVFNHTQLKDHYYGGTMFRFPLRKPENKSKLSSDEYSPSKLELLFEQFEQYSYMCLMFLTSLESIELYVRQSREQQPHLVFKVALSENSRANVVENRQKFRDNINTETWMESPVCMTQEVLIDAQNTTTTSHHWLVTNFFAGGDELTTLKGMFNEKSLFYPPWVSVAMSMNDDFEPEQPRGHVFCFLPLPVEQRSQTGLPIHVNGFFAIDQNRRHLKWPNAEQLGAELSDKGLRWNQTMLAEAVPMAYKELVENAIKLNVSQKLVYNGIPFLNVVDDKWHEMVHVFLKHMSQIPFLHTEQGGGRYVRIDEALFSFLSVEQHPDVINAVLLEAGRPVVCIPEHVRCTIEAIEGVNFSVVTPGDLREAVRRIQNKVNPFPDTRAHCMQILAYATDDDQFDRLVGLKLVPLESGTCDVFQMNGSHEKVFMTNSDHPTELFPGLEHRLVSYATSYRGTQLLEKIAKSDKTNMVLMKKEDAVKMFPLVFPSHWVGDILTWTPDQEKYVTLPWIKSVWNYLVKMFLDDLSPVEGLNLLPLKSDDGVLFLKRLTRKSSVIFYDEHSGCFRDNTSDLLKKLGVLVADDLFPFIKRHPCIYNYVNKPTVSGVLQALSSADQDLLTKKMRELSPELVQKFCFEIAQGDVHVLNQFRDLLRAFPMFSVTKNTLSQVEDRLYALQEIDCMAPDQEFPFKLPNALIHVDNEFSKHLSRILGVKELSLSDLFVDHVFPSITAYTSADVDKILEYLLLYHMELVDGNSKLRDNVTQLDVFQRCDGELTNLKSLFDPSDEKLMKIFYGQDVFLAGACSSEKILSNLRSLGLKTYKDVEPGEILQATRRIETLPYDKNAILKAKEIRDFLSIQKLGYLGKQVDGCSLRHHLQDTAWVPVKTRPGNYPDQLTWFGEHNKFQKPCLLHDTAHDNLVGALKEVASVRMIPGLSLSETTLKDVVDNLLNVAMECNPTTDNFLQLRNLVFDSYEYMQREIIRTPQKSRDMAAAFKGMKSILIDDGRLFVSPDEVSFTEDLAPFRYKIPHEMKQRFQALLKTMGVQDKFKSSDYYKVLSDITVHSSSCPLSKERLDLVRRAAELLAESVTSDGITQDVYLPNDAEGVMKLSSTLCYNDCPWLPDADMPFVHKSITFDVAVALGVKTKRSKTLESSSYGIPFGQREKLTNRIKRILDGYPGDVDILKEMLQNADDAQASEICFCLDSRNHSTDRIFGDSWEPLQGPALCVYNNRPFTEDDVNAIRNLGEGNKGNDPTKTGQYGVGFNAVYHITDVPSLLTNVVGKGERLFVFDPHCTYVPSATRQEPGRCYEDLKTLRETFPSVFECYMSVLDVFVDAFEGTLFRFPFRNEEMARKSEIKTKPTTVRTLRNMLELFKREASKCLLFLNNVRKITVCEIGESDGVLQTFTVSALHDGDSEKKLDEFKTYVKAGSAMMRINPGNVWSFQSKDVAYEMSLSSSNGSSNKWLVVQKFGFDTNVQGSQILRDAFTRNELQLLPRGGVAVNMSKQDFKHNVFCFLPLPQQTDLPVHINGHFALDHEARRRIWTSTDKDAKSEWNGLLMRFVIAHAYVRLVEEYKHRVIGCSSGTTATLSQLKTFQKLFPLTHKESGDFKDIVRSFYKIIFNNQASVLCMVDVPLEKTESRTVTWFSPSHEGPQGPLFDTLLSTVMPPWSENDLKRYKKLKGLFLKCGLKILWDGVTPLRDEFKMSEVPTDASSFATILEFFKAPNAVLSEPTDVTDILKFCKKAENFAECLQDVHLLMTESRKMQKFTAEHPKYLTRHTLLVDEQYHDEFVHHQLLNSVLAPEKFLRVPVFKKFAIESLVTMLPQRFKGKFEFKYEKEANFDIWIEKLWSFINEALQDTEDSDENSLDKHLGDFCLIPAYRDKDLPNKDHVLVQVRRSKSVVVDSGRRMFVGGNIVHILKRLDVPILSDINLCLRSVVSSVDKPLDILTAIELNMENGIVSDILTKSQCLDLLNYLCSNLNKTDSDVLRRIKLLPFFCTRSGSFVSVGDKEAFILHNDIPTKDATLWENNEETVFLEVHGARIMEFLGIKKMILADLYKYHVLQHFDHFSDDGRREHLLFIKNKVFPTLVNVDRKSFISVMKEVSFIENDCGYLVKASAYFDWENTVFDEMLTEDHFPPKYFKTDEWRSFLLELGLQNRVSDDQFVGFANEVARHRHDTESQYKDKCRKSEVLITYLLDNQMQKEWSFSLTTLSRVKDIPFVPQEALAEKFLRLHPRYSKEKFVKMNGAVVCSSSNDRLVWSAAYLVPTILRVNDKLAKALGIDLIPPVSLVIKHCSNVCKNLYGQKPSSNKVAWESGLVLNIMKNVYSFLKTNTTKISFSDQEVLRKTPLVVVNESNVFVYARQVVEDIRQDQQIQPYLYKLPTEVAEFKQLFIFLGASVELNVNILAAVLLEIAQCTHSEFLHVEEKKKARKALISLLRCSDDAIENASFKHDLFVPTRDEMMLLARECVFVDDERLYEEIKSNFGYPVLTKTLVEVFDSKQKFLKFDEQHRPMILSEVVHEQLEKEGDIQSHDSSDVPVVKEIFERLTSSMFHHALARLIFHISSQNNNPTMDILNIVQEKFEKVKVFEAGAIKSYYVDTSGNKLCESTNCTKVSVIRGKESFLEIYIHPSEERFEIYDRLTEYIAENMGVTFDNRCLMVLRELLMLENSATNLSSYLDKNRILILPVQEPDIQLGEKISGDMSHIMEQGFLAFDVDELVGYETGKRNDDGEPEYVIAQVCQQLESCEESPGGIKRRYLVNVGGEKIEVDSVDLHKFWRPTRQREDDELCVFDTEAIKKEIDNQMEEARAMPEHQRGRVMRRLFMHWHPYTDEENTEARTEIFDYLERSVTKYEESTHHSVSVTIDQQSIRRRVTMQYDRRRRCRQSYTASGGTGGGLWFLANAPALPNPRPSSASQWYRQAVDDFNSSQNDIPPGAVVESYVWACYKCHQSAEKALKAAQFAVDANLKSETHNLATIAHTLDMPDLRELRRLAVDLRSRLGDSTKMRYPDVFGSGIPSDYFTERHAEEAKSITGEILDIVRMFLKSRGVDVDHQ